MKNINAGLVGYGFMGKAHSNAFRQVNHFFDADAKINLTAICGRNKSSVQDAMDKFGFCSYETDYRNLIKRDDIDFIDVTAPSNAHMEIVMMATENKKHVFCEKPLGMNKQEAKEMLDSALKNKVKHQVGFNYRFAPAIRLAKKMIDEGKLGTIYHFRGLYLQDWIVDPSFPLVWRLDKKVCGSGANGDLNAHMIDLARYLVGEIDKVTGTSKTFIKSRPVVEHSTGLNAKSSHPDRFGEVTVDDTTLFLAHFSNGAVGSFEATRFATGRKNGMSFEINGSKGSIRFEFERMNELQYFCNEDDERLRGFRVIQVTDSFHEYAANWWPVGHVLGYEHTFVHEFFEFAQSITNDIPAIPDFHDGYMCNVILDCVDLSIKENTWINIG
ncbi:MAG: Gfo/Idh/MocA family oxidoreductase [Clostridia bacterium]|nr:Gfo/Idh/MocA family oxidoreductase [Clostridia bacterium]